MNRFYKQALLKNVLQPLILLKLYKCNWMLLFDVRETLDEWSYESGSDKAAPSLSLYVRRDALFLSYFSYHRALI